VREMGGRGKRLCCVRVSMCCVSVCLSGTHVMFVCFYFQCESVILHAFVVCVCLCTYIVPNLRVNDT